MHTFQSNYWIFVRNNQMTLLFFFLQQFSIVISRLSTKLLTFSMIFYLMNFMKTEICPLKKYNHAHSISLSHLHFFSQA